VRDSRTTLVLDTLKETQALSLQFIECRQPKKTTK
jgi:Lrp/AsnC family leucine-responsive transcriptional regulator